MLDLIATTAALGEFVVNKQVVFNGLVTGFTYGVLAVGLVLVYRSTRVINFAYGEMGAFGAALLARLVINWDVNFYVSFAAVLVVGAIGGAIVELTIVRRLFKAPRVILFVATLGAAQLIFLCQLLLPGLERFSAYPTALDSRWDVGGVVIQSQHLLVLVIVPVLTLALAYFLGRTKYGTAIRASAANSDAARLSAISVKQMSTIVWVLAGLLATVTAVLVTPLRGGTAAMTSALGSSLLLRALAAALIGRMRSLPLALLGGAAIGVAEAVFFFNYPDEPGLIDAVLFLVVLVAVLLLARSSRDEERGTGWSFAPRVKPVPKQLEQLWWVRHLPHIGSALALAAAALLPVVFDQASRQFLYSRMLLFAIVALSLTALTGWAGQLSLGQFAFVGLGALLTASLVNGMQYTLPITGTTYEVTSIPFELAVPIAVAACALAALVVGTPALRVRGLFLAVTTLAFAVMAESWLFTRPFLLGDSNVVFLRRARWGDGFSLEPQRTYYYLCLVALIITVFVMRRIRYSGIGRALIAVRDNEQGAAAFTVSPTRVKLMAFGVGGALAGLAGALLAGLLVQFGPDAFSPEQSLRVVSIAVIGGLASITGAILGAVWVIGLPALFDNTQEVALLTSGAGLLILLMYFPGGLVQILYSARDALFAWLARRLPEPTIVRAPAAPIPVRVGRAEAAHADAPVALATHGVTVHFGGRVAVDHVDIEVRRGEVVGLIGTNGAGKSTLMNAVGGFVPCTGSVEVLGRSVDGLSPARRARLGLGRTFQSADLFADLTVRETLQVALEARGKTTLPSTVLMLPKARRLERAKQSEAEELIAFFGLGRYADTFINELSTGTRRIVELGCLLALDARLLCLDEPTAGVAQRETEAFAPLVLRIREELGASLLVIEHDMPFILGISDRVYCLEAGAIIAEGAPSDVRRDPAVIASYLGTDERAIQRSGVVVAD
jgi:ABC-type branched-subunit amino acid transport system ATPase component/ABC-type branched-subunit amino acid transport system permease subunit